MEEQQTSAPISTTQAYGHVKKEDREGEVKGTKYDMHDPLNGQLKDTMYYKYVGIILPIWRTGRE